MLCIIYYLNKLYYLFSLAKFVVQNRSNIMSSSPVREISEIYSAMATLEISPHLTSNKQESTGEHSTSAGARRKLCFNSSEPVHSNYDMTDGE